MNWIARVGAVLLGVSWGCTTTNESHCGNQNGDATCMERGFDYCDRCSAVNDGCSNTLNTAPGCHEGDIGTTSGSSNDSATSTVTTDTTTMSTSMTMTSTDATDDSTSGGPPPLCPNGMIDDGEECDGENLNGADCVSQGFPMGGELACGGACTFDVAGCEPVMGCGDHELQEGEDCEPADTAEPVDLTGADCMSVGSQFGGDGLACNANCTFNTDECCIADGFQCSDNVPCCGDCVAITNLCLGSG